MSEDASASADTTRRLASGDAAGPSALAVGHTGPLDHDCAGDCPDNPDYADHTDRLDDLEGSSGLGCADDCPENSDHADRPSRPNRVASIKRGGAYLAKSCVIIAVLYLFSRYAGSAPSLCIALVWAVLSVASALGITYHHVVRKTLRQQAYVKEGRLSALNNGRTICLIVSFVASAWCMAGLMVEAAKWEAAEWGLAIAAIPLYLGVSLVVQRLARGEYKPAFRTSKAAILSCLVVTGLLCCACLVISLVQPAETFESASEAFLSVGQPFENSPSKLASEAGTISALVDGLTVYGMSRAAEATPGISVILRIVLVVSALGGLVSLLSLCSLELPELKRVFLPLETDAPSPVVASPGPGRTVARRNVVMTIVLPAILVAAFLVADAAVVKAAETEEYTAAQRFVRDQVDLAVYVLDGTYYEYKAVQEVLQEAQAESTALTEEAEAVLVPLVNASYDARLANVDAYLDWYYSLPADYERLVNMITGSVEDYVQEQFVEQIEAGVDDSELEGQLQMYWDKAEELEENLMARLADCEIAGVPEWLPVTKDEVEADFFLDSLEPSQQFVSAGERFLASAGTGALAGAGTGVAAKKLVSKAVEKPFFKAVVSEITKKLSSKAAGAAVGGAVGSLAGPAGTVLGAVVGGAASIGVDYGLLKLDEALNRETYREEVVQTIEDARAEMLAVVQAA